MEPARRLAPRGAHPVGRGRRSLSRQSDQVRGRQGHGRGGGHRPLPLRHRPRAVRDELDAALLAVRLRDRELQRDEQAPRSSALQSVPHRPRSQTRRLHRRQLHRLAADPADQIPSPRRAFTGRVFVRLQRRAGGQGPGRAHLRGDDQGCDVDGRLPARRRRDPLRARRQARTADRLESADRCRVRVQRRRSCCAEGADGACALQRQRLRAGHGNGRAGPAGARSGECCRLPQHLRHLAHPAGSQHLRPSAAQIRSLPLRQPALDHPDLPQSVPLPGDRSDRGDRRA